MAKIKNILVDASKQKRATDIVRLLSVAMPRTEEEAEMKRKFGAILSEARIDHKKDEEGAIEFIYEHGLGGLVRSPEKHAKVTAAAAKSRSSKKIDADAGDSKKKPDASEEDEDTEGEEEDETDDSEEK